MSSCARTSFPAEPTRGWDAAVHDRPLRGTCAAVSIGRVTGASTVDDAADVRALSAHLCKRSLDARLTALRLLVEAEAVRLHVDIAQHLRNTAVR